MDTFRGRENFTQMRIELLSIIEEAKLKMEEINIYLNKFREIKNADASAPVGGVSAAVSGCVLILAVGLLLLYAVFRKRVEYRLYRVKLILKQQVRRWKRVREDETLVLEDKKVDVYLSYGEEDYPWVRTRLLPLLDNEDREELLNKDREELLIKEDREKDNHPTGMDKYRVYCGDRDAHPSKTELENICENIEQSRMALVVLSNNYTQKPLHTWELEHILFCKDEAIIEGLVLIMMEELTYKQIPSSLHRQVQQDNVLRWEMYRTKERKFHKDLLRSLR